MKRLIAILLCIVLCAMSIVPVFAASIPEGLTSEEVLSAIPKTELLVKNLLLKDENGKNLDDIVYGMLFEDKTVNAVFAGVYSALTENEAAMKTLGIDISLQGVAAKLSAYPEVSEYLNSCETWSDALKSMNCRWGIKSKDGFKKALAAMFSPFQNLLYTLLCGGRYKVNAIIYVDGDVGYQNAVMPLFRALGCPNVLSQETFTAHAKEKASSQVKDIVDMLYAVIDNILSSPVDKLCTVLPSFALYTENGGLSSALESLIAPLKVRVGFISIPGLDKLISQGGMLADPSALTDMFANMDLSAITGSDIKLTLPEFDLKALASCCSYQNGIYTTDKACAMCEILRWTVKLLRLNKDALLSSFGEMPAEISGYIDELLAKSDDELIKFLFGVLSITSEDSVLDYQWKYPEYVPGAITYTPNLTQTEYQKVLMDVDDTLNEFMKEFGDGTLSDTISGMIYSDNIVTMLVKTLYGALYSEQTSQIMSFVGLDASPKGVAEKLKGAYPAVAAKLAVLTKWEDLSEDNISWGFAKGSRAGFEKALIAVLRPLIPFLDLLLAQGEITLFGAITLSGSNGYNTAVIPILDALGCGDIKSYSQYKDAAGTDNSLKYILDPVCDMIDTLIQKPVRTLCFNLPNILYFVNSGGIKQCVDNLMYPVTNLLEKLGMSSLMPASLSELGNIDAAKLITDLSANGTLPIKLPPLDLTLIASLGQAEQMDSKRVYNGLYTPFTYIRADAPAVFVTVLRYLVDALALPENESVLASVVPGGNAEQGNDMFAMYAGEITSKLKNMSTDETIEWLYDLLFKETPKKEITTVNEEIPTVIYQPTKDYTALKRALLIAAVIIIPVLIVIYVAKTDFSAKKERKERKKMKKKAAKQTVKTSNGKAQKPNASYSVTPVKPRNASVTQREVVRNSRHERFSSEEPENISRQIQQLESMQPKNLHEKAERDKALLKLKSRQDKAVKKAMKNAKKADKYYSQALNESKKRK